MHIRPYNPSALRKFADKEKTASAENAETVKLLFFFFFAETEKTDINRNLAENFRYRARI